MAIRYDQNADKLTISLGMNRGECYEYKVDDFTVAFDEADAMVRITVANARQFVAQALAAGIEIEGAPAVKPQGPGVWHDADSSMISAFRYDEAESILEVAFHSSGVYRYFDVPIEVFDGLCDASSKGGYMRGWIIDMYRYEKKRGR